MDSDNSESGKEEEDDDEDSSKTELNRLLDHQKTYMQMCQTSAKILQVLAGFSAPQTTHIIELESVSDDSEVSSCSSPDSLSQSPNTEEASRSESAECVIWAEPLMTCQIVTPAKQPCPDARRLPPGVTPDDVKRSKEEAAKTRAAVIANIETEERKKQTQRTQSSIEQKSKSSCNYDEATIPGLSGTSQFKASPGSSKTTTGTFTTCTQTNNLNSQVSSSMLEKTFADNHMTSLSSVNAVSSSLAATREDFKRAMSQISCASETIRQAHSLLTSMGLGHYSLRRRLSQLNNNNNPDPTEQNEETAQHQQGASCASEKSSSLATQTYTIIEERSIEEVEANSVCKESTNDITESMSNFPTPLMVKPAQSQDGNRFEGSSIPSMQLGSKNVFSLKDDMKKGGSGDFKSSISMAKKQTVSSGSSTGLNSAYPSQGNNIKNSTNIRQLRDMCSNTDRSTDSLTKWSSHLQSQRCLASTQHSCVTRFTNRFMGQSSFSRNAPLLNRTKKSTNLSNNTEKCSEISPIDEPKKENINCCNKSSNAHCSSTEVKSNEISKQPDHKGPKEKAQIKLHSKIKHRITFNDVKEAVDFAMENLQKSGKWTESWERKDVIDTQKEFRLDVSLNGLSPIAGISSDKTLDSSVDNPAKGITFLQDSSVTIEHLKDCKENKLEDAVCETTTTVDSKVNEYLCNTPSSNIEQCDEPTTVKDKYTQFSVENLKTFNHAEKIPDLLTINVLKDSSNNKEIEEDNEFNNSTQNSQILTSSNEINVREAQGDTTENAVVQSKKSYFHRLKEICDNQTLKGRDNTIRTVDSTGNEDLLPTRMFNEFQEKNGIKLEIQNFKTANEAKELKENKDPEVLTAHMEENDQDSSVGISKTMNALQMIPSDIGQGIKEWNKSSPLAYKHSVITDGTEILQMGDAKAGEDIEYTNVLCTEGIVRELPKDLDNENVKELKYSTNGSQRDVVFELYDCAGGSVGQTESSDIATATFTKSSSTVDHIHVLTEDETEVLVGEQNNEITNIQPIVSQDSINANSKTVSISPHLSASCQNSNHFFSNIETDNSTTITMEAMYKPSFVFTPSNSSEENESTQSSCDDRLFEIVTCETSVNPHHSLSAGDIHPKNALNTELPHVYRSNIRSVSPMCISVRATSAFDRYKRKRSANLRSRLSNVRPSSHQATSVFGGPSQNTYHIEKLQLENVPQICDIGYQRVKSADNSPRHPDCSVVPKWNKMSKPKAPGESVTTHSSSVSIIEMLEEHKPEPLIFPEPSLSKDLFGIKQSMQTIALDEEQEKEETKATIHLTPIDSDEESADGEDTKKFSCTSFFSRPRRLRLRRRRRRNRQRFNSRCARGLRWIRTKFRSLFSRCLPRE